MTHRRSVLAKAGKKKCEFYTYVVQMGLHVYESEGFFEENNEHATWNAVVVELIVVHVCLLGEYERRMFES